MCQCKHCLKNRHVHNNSDQVWDWLVVKRLPFTPVALTEFHDEKKTTTTKPDPNLTLNVKENKITVYHKTNHSLQSIVYM